MNAKTNPEPHLSEEAESDDLHSEALEAAMLEEEGDADINQVHAANAEDESDSLDELDGVNNVDGPNYDTDSGVDFELKDACLSIATNQLQVNTLMAGTDWIRRGYEHSDIDYRMATLDEMQEFWTSAWNFKWWDKKKATIDYRNARMELVDVLHFIVSEDIVLRLEGNPGDPHVTKWVADAMLEGVYEAEDDIGGPLVEEVRVGMLKTAMMRFIHDLTAETPEVSWLNFWKMVMLSDPASEGDCMGEAWKVINLYRAKAVLNKFRTIHRASERGYKKVWIDGREDNDIMMAWLDQQPKAPSDQELNLWLEQMYSRVIGA